MHFSRPVALYQRSVLPSACHWKALLLTQSERGEDSRNLPVKIQMDPLGALSFIFPRSIAGSSAPQLIINCKAGKEGRQAGLLFPLLKKDCQLSNSPQLKSQYISWRFFGGWVRGAQLLCKALYQNGYEEVRRYVCDLKYRYLPTVTLAWVHHN